MVRSVPGGVQIGVPDSYSVGPVLTDRSLRYKRNCLILSVAAILAYLIPSASVEKARIFELTLGPHIWWVGAALLIYNLAMFSINVRQDFVAWDQKTVAAATHGLYRKFFPFLGISLSVAFRPRNFCAAITARSDVKHSAVAAKQRSAGQYVAFLLFDVVLTVVLAIPAFSLALIKTWSFFAPVSWGLC